MGGDALANLNNAIVSGDGPDLILLQGLNAERLAAGGALEDLSPWLEKSGALDREELLESILNAYTFGDILAGIPQSFLLQTAVAGAGGLGETRRWTPDEVMALANARPDAELFHNADKSFVMEYLLLFGMDEFVDFQTGECRFDSPRFQEVLRFVSQFPEQADGRETDAAPVRIQRGEVLLFSEPFVSDFDRVQVYRAIFGEEPVCVGYPTADGRGAHVISAPVLALGICSESREKEGAWEFVESVLTREQDNFEMEAFPVLKKNLEAKIRETLSRQDFGSISYGSGAVMGSASERAGWAYTFRETTKEEADVLLRAMEAARLAPESNREILKIINEEAEACFRGQKTAEETARVIQSRVGMYVKEKAAGD